MPFVNDIQFLIADAAGPPAPNPGFVIGDAVPVHLPHESANAFETFPAVEIDHPGHHFIAGALFHQFVLLFDEMLAAGRTQIGVFFEIRDEGGEIVRPDFDVSIHLADVVVVAGGDPFVTKIESFHHAGPHGSNAAVFAFDHPYPRMSFGCTPGNGVGIIFGPVIDQNPFHRLQFLGDDRIDGSLKIFRFVPHRGHDDDTTVICVAQKFLRFMLRQNVWLTQS